MKNIIMMLAIAMLCGIQVTAQKLSEAKVPEVVKSVFKNKFPNATNVSWEQENKDSYEAGFKSGGQKQSALFDKGGKWQVTETEIESSKLPKTVTEAFAKEYPGYKLKEAEHMDTADSGELYELEITKGAEKLEVQFSPVGKVVKKETVKGKD
jgi:hypothetical protein